MPRPLKRGILGASTIILSKDIDKYAFMCSSNFYETDVICHTFCTFSVLFFCHPHFHPTVVRYVSFNSKVLGTLLTTLVEIRNRN